MLLRSLCLTGILLLVVGAGPPQSPEPPAGSISHYDLTSTTELHGAPGSQHSFSIALVDLPGQGTKTIIVLAGGGTDDSKPALPFWVMREDAGGKVIVELGHPSERLVPNAVESLLRVQRFLTPETLQGPPQGKRELTLIGLRFRKPIPVSYEIQPVDSEGGGKQIEYLAHLDGEPVVTDFGGYKVSVESLSEKLLFRPTDDHFMEGTWSRTVLQEYSGHSHRQVERLHLTEKSWRALSGKEAEQVGAEVAKLRPVAQAILPGRFDVSIAEKAAKDLEGYKSEFPKGLLASVVEDLESALAKKRQQLERPADPDILAQGLIGKEAPEFTLESLDGKQVSISQLRGKVVLLTFWALA